MCDCVNMFVRRRACVEGVGGGGGPSQCAGVCLLADTVTKSLRASSLKPFFKTYYTTHGAATSTENPNSSS